MGWYCFYFASSTDKSPNDLSMNFKQFFELLDCYFKPFMFLASPCCADLILISLMLLIFYWGCLSSNKRLRTCSNKSLRTCSGGTRLKSFAFLFQDGCDSEVKCSGSSNISKPEVSSSLSNWGSSLDDSCSILYTYALALSARLFSSL